MPCSKQLEPLWLEHLQQHRVLQPVAHVLRLCLAAFVCKLDVMLQTTMRQRAELLPHPEPQK